jgi:hypothetical protein
VCKNFRLKDAKFPSVVCVGPTFALPPQAIQKLEEILKVTQTHWNPEEDVSIPYAAYLEILAKEIQSKEKNTKIRAVIDIHRYVIVGTIFLLVIHDRLNRGG